MQQFISSLGFNELRYLPFKKYFKLHEVSLMAPLQEVEEGDGTLQEQSKKEKNTPLNTFERKRHKNK